MTPRSQKRDLGHPGMFIMRGIVAGLNRLRKVGCMSLLKDDLESFFGYHGFRLVHQLQGFLLSQLNQPLG
jgi:hypothetical protein